MNDFRQPGPSTESDYSELNVYPCFMPDEPCIAKIVEWIHGAQKFIIVQAYSFSSNAIADALIKAKQRNVKVQIMVDKNAEKKPNSLIPRLKDHGIEIQVDLPVHERSKAHNKVMIIDDSRVITGSYNWTDEEYYNDSDVVIFIKDVCVNQKFRYNCTALHSSYINTDQISRNTVYRNTRPSYSERAQPYPKPKPYNALHNEYIWLTGRLNCQFCSVPLNDLSHSTVEDGYTEFTSKSKKKKQKSENFVEVDVCFPRLNYLDCIKLITNYINNAKESIFIQACSLTHSAVITALKNAHKNTKDIKLLVDEKAFGNKGEQVTTLIRSGVEVRCDKTCHSGIAHSKIIIIDDDIVLAGSFNLTYNAQNHNQENLLHMKNINVNRMFKKYFYTKWNVSKPPSMHESTGCVVS